MHFNLRIIMSVFLLLPLSTYTMNDPKTKPVSEQYSLKVYAERLYNGTEAPEELTEICYTAAGNTYTGTYTINTKSYFAFDEKGKLLKPKVDGHLYEFKNGTKIQRKVVINDERVFTSIAGFSIAALGLVASLLTKKVVSK
jgi:hypothetical protein